MKQLLSRSLIIVVVFFPYSINALELTPQQMSNVTLSTTTVTLRQAAATLTVNGTLRADQQRLFQISPVVDGFVTALNVVAHTQVKKGQVLAQLRSTTLGQAQTDYLEALARYNVAKADYLRIKGLSDDGVVATSRLLAADSQFKMAEAVLNQRSRELTLAGMTPKQIKQLAQHPNKIASYALLSPANGTLLEVSVEKGQMLNAGQPAFRMADLSVIWADVQIPVTHIGSIALGSQVNLRVTAYPQQNFGGRLEALSGEVDINSQTVSGRVVIDNQQKLLRPGMYVQAEITGTTQSGLMVPTSAVFRSGNDNYVFIVTGPRRFKPVKVTNDEPINGWVKINSGIQTGDVVVSSGAAELKSHWQYQGGE